VRNRLLNLVKIVISIVLLILVFRIVDVGEAWQALRGINLPLFGLAFLLFALSLILRSYRWRFLLEAVDVHMPVHRLVYLYFAGVFFNTFLPSGFGGDAIKMYELNRYSKKGSESISTVLMDRLTGIIMLFIMGLIALPLARDVLPREQLWFLGIVSLGGLVATWVLFQRKLADLVLRFMPGAIREKLASLYDAIHACGTRALGKALAVSALFNLTLFALNYCLARALGAQVSIVHIAAFMPLISLSMLIPSVGALGTRESAYVFLFGSAGVPEAVAAAMSLAFYLVNVLTGLIGGALYAINAMRDMGQDPTLDPDGEANPPDEAQEGLDTRSEPS